MTLIKYFVPRRWLKRITVMVVFLVALVFLLVLEGGSIMYIWAKGSVRTTQQLEELIPLESNKVSDEVGIV